MVSQAESSAFQEGDLQGYKTQEGNLRGCEQQLYERQLSERQPSDDQASDTQVNNRTNPSHHRSPLHPGIYLVTDPDLSMKRAGLNPADFQSEKAWHIQAMSETVHSIREANKAGVKVIQLRWKNVDAGYLLHLTQLAADALSPDAQLFINDRVDVFLAAKANGIRVDGVHVGQTDIPATLVRDMIGPDALLGLSAASPEELVQAEEIADQLDYLGVGTLRDTATKTDAPQALGLEGISRIADTCSLPIVAIGGIKYPDIAGIASTNIYSAAVVSALVCASDIYQTSRDFVQTFDDARCNR